MDIVITKGRLLRSALTAKSQPTDPKVLTVIGDEVSFNRVSVLSPDIVNGGKSDGKEHEFRLVNVSISKDGGLFFADAIQVVR